MASIAARITLGIQLTPRRAGPIPFIVSVAPLAGGPTAQSHILQLEATE